MISLLRKSSRRDDDRGASAVEYALLVAAIAAVIVAIVFGLGGVVKGIFTSTCTEISSSAKVSAGC
jgi:pilus assembly protein Flp/PilA